MCYCIVFCFILNREIYLLFGIRICLVVYDFWMGYVDKFYEFYGRILWKGERRRNLFFYFVFYLVNFVY